MTREEHLQVIASARPTYTFHRSEGFYPLEMSKGDEEARANAECNPGTQEVRCAFTGRLVWSDGNDGRPRVGRPQS
jgi:hypothetical protein